MPIRNTQHSFGGEAAAPSLTLFIKEACPWCVAAERELARCGLTYKRLDVNRDPAAFAELRRISGQSLAPTLQLDAPHGPVLADFGVEDLSPFLATHGIL